MTCRIAGLQTVIAWFFWAGLVLGGCDFAEELYHMKAPELRSHHPDSRFVELGEDGNPQYIALRFSTQMDSEATERAFELTHNGRPVSGRFRWERTRMRFYPDEPIRSAALYRYALTTEAQDRYGNALRAAFSFTFRTGVNELPPSLVEHRPSAGATAVHRRAPLSFHFSQPVLRGSWLQAFRLTPAVAGGFEWNENDTRVSFTPAEDYRRDTEYRVQVGTELLSVSGTPKADRVEFRFHTGPLEPAELTGIRISGRGQTLEPVETAWSNDGIEREDSFILSFNRAIASDERAAVLSVIPRREHLLRWSDSGAQATLEFPQGLVRDERYELVLLGTSYRVAVNGPRSLPPRVHGVWFNRDLEEHDSEFVRLALNDIVVMRETGRAAFDVAIIHAVGSQIELGRFMDTFSIEPGNPAVELRPRRVQIVTDDYTVEAPPDSSAQSFTTVRVETATTPYPVSGTMTIRLTDRFQDSFGNRKRQPFALSVNY